MNTLIVYAHPVADSFCGALLTRVMQTVEEQRHEMRLRDLCAESFDPVVDRDELSRHLDPPEDKPELQPYFDDLRWAQRLILVYPTWWGAQPAVLKGWFERVFVRGVAWEFPNRGSRLVPLLTNITSVIAVTTHGSTKWINSLQGEAGKRTLKRGVRSFVGRGAKIRWVAFYGIDRDIAARRTVFLERVARALAT